MRLFFNCSVKFVVMKTIIQKYLIDTNFWVSFCFGCLLAFFQLSFYELNFYVLGIVFFGTLAVYNFTRMSDLKELYTFKPETGTRVILTYIGLIFTLGFVILRGFELKTFLYLSVLGFVSFCYSLPFSGLGLRAIPFLKLFLIAFVWAGSSVGLLLVVHHELIHHKMIFTAVFLFVAGITIPFDIRDQNTDDKELKTIPMVIGFRNSKILAIVFLLLSAFFFFWELKEIDKTVISWFCAIIFSLGGIINTKSSNSTFYFSFWMESCSLIPLIAWLLFSI